MVFKSSFDFFVESETGRGKEKKGEAVVEIGVDAAVGATCVIGAGTTGAETTGTEATEVRTAVGGVTIGIGVGVAEGMTGAETMTGVGVSCLIGRDESKSDT